VENYSPSPCVHCGECCKSFPCGYGKHTEESYQCVYLTPTEVTPEYTLYTCGIHDEIIKDPSSYWSPAFGAGCCRNLFNEVRENIIRHLRQEVEG
jgi:hypothetical protein